MLPLLLLLAHAPQAQAAAVVPADRPPTATMRTLGRPSLQCEPRTLPTDHARSGADLMWREGGEPVRMYHLLERRIGGCSAPIVVMERVPGSNALGREMGRDVPLPSGAVRP